MRERAARPKLGTSPSATLCVADMFRGLSFALISTRLLRVDARTPPLDSRVRENDELRGRSDQEMSRMINERLLEPSIPDRSPGHAFIAIAHAGCRRHAKV